MVTLPTQWDFSQFPFNTCCPENNCDIDGDGNVGCADDADDCLDSCDADFQDVTVTATVTDYFQFPVFNAEIVLDAPQANFFFVCGGEDTDLDGVIPQNI